MATKFVCTGIKSFWMATLFVWMATKISMTLPTVFCTATLFVYTGIK
jgi:hypothetical protein